jgi:hypothetical protein
MSDLLDLDNDLPTTPEDIQALRENRPKPAKHWLVELQELADQFPASEEDRRRRPTAEGREPFEL